jgi:hypothetical protein
MSRLSVGHHLPKLLSTVGDFSDELYFDVANQCIQSQQNGLSSAIANMTEALRRAELALSQKGKT